MTEIVAIDVALLLPKEVVEIVTSMNAALVRAEHSPIRFGENGSLPHLTLAMACVRTNDIEHINQRIADIAKRFSPLPLQLESFSADEALPTGEHVSSFGIQKSPEIHELQRSVQKSLVPFLAPGLSREMLFQANEVGEKTFEWMKKYVDGFPQTTTFNPHVTVGIRVTQSVVSLPLSFTATQLAVCHLGNNCTCNTVFGYHALSVN